MYIFKATMCLLFLFLSTQLLAHDCQNRIDWLVEQQRQGEKPDINYLLSSAKKCTQSFFVLTLAQEYLDDNNPKEALKVLAKAEDNVLPEQTQTRGYLAIIKSQAYLQMKNHCRAHYTMISAKQLLGEQDENIKSLRMEFDAVRAKTLYNADEINCLMNSSKSAAKGTGIAPYIDISIGFDTDKDIPNGTGLQQLGELGKALSLAGYKEYHFTLVGHTDGRGSSNYNQQLSERRAKSVAILLGNDYPELDARISTKGRGEEELKTRAMTLEAHMINRRVEVQLHKRKTN